MPRLTPGQQRSNRRSAPSHADRYATLHPYRQILQDVADGLVWWYPLGSDGAPVICRSIDGDRHKVVTSIAEPILARGHAVLTVDVAPATGGRVWITPAGRDALAAAAARSQHQPSTGG